MTATHHTHTTTTQEWKLPANGPIGDVATAAGAAQQEAHTAGLDVSAVYYRTSDTQLTIGFVVETTFEDGDPA